jgi:Flp pilus assembly protein TadD
VPKLVPQTVPQSNHTAAALRVAFLPGAAFLGGCQTNGLQEVTASAGATPQPSETEPVGDKRRAAEEWGRQYDRHPEDKAIALSYAAALRGTAEYTQAAAVLQRLAIKFPRDMEVLGAYGKALGDAGRLREAAEVLQRAHTPDRPNWSILSAQGSVADRLGDHEQAQAYYAAALKSACATPCPLQSWALLRAFKKNFLTRKRLFRKRRRSKRPMRGCGRILRLFLPLRGNSIPLKPYRGAILVPRKQPRTLRRSGA